MAYVIAQQPKQDLPITTTRSSLDNYIILNVTHPLDIKDFIYSIAPVAFAISNVELV